MQTPTRRSRPFPSVPSPASPPPRPPPSFLHRRHHRAGAGAAGDPRLPGRGLPSPGAPAAHPGPAGACRSPRDQPRPQPSPAAAAGSGSCPAGGCAGGGAPGEGPGTRAAACGASAICLPALALPRAAQRVVRRGPAPWGPTALHESRRRDPHIPRKAEPLTQEVACVRSSPSRELYAPDGASGPRARLGAAPPTRAPLCPRCPPSPIRRTGPPPGSRRQPASCRRAQMLFMRPLQSPRTVLFQVI